MIRCPKCGAYDISGPVYDEQADLLAYRCVQCGYRQTSAPLDKRSGRARATTPPEIRDALNKARPSGA